jgi:hypothetical protein
MVRTEILADHAAGVLMANDHAGLERLWTEYRRASFRLDRQIRTLSA